MCKASYVNGPLSRATIASLKLFLFPSRPLTQDKKWSNMKALRGRRKWQPTPVVLPGESHGQRSLPGYSPWGRKESDMTERLTHTHTHWKWKSFSRVWLFDTVHGIFQTRILEWVAVPFSRVSSQPRDRIQVSHIAGRFFTSGATREGQVWLRRSQKAFSPGSILSKTYVCTHWVLISHYFGVSQIKMFSEHLALTVTLSCLIVATGLTWTRESAKPFTCPTLLSSDNLYAFYKGISW